jgi:hypothetical protein
LDLNIWHSAPITMAEPSNTEEKNERPTSSQSSDKEGVSIAYLLLHLLGSKNYKLSIC